MRRGAIVATLVGLAVLSVGGSFAHRELTKRLAQRAVVTAWARLSRCLVGTAPLGVEKPSERLRRIEVGVWLRAQNRAAAPEDAGWPERCALYASELSRRWDDARDAQDASFASLGRLSESLSRREVPDRLVASENWFDSVWASGTRLVGEPGDLGDVVPAPAPVEPTRLETLPDLGDASLLRDLEPVAGKSLRFTLANGGEALVFDPARALLAVKRFRRSPKIPTGPSERLVGSEDGAPLLLAVYGNEEGGVFAYDTGDRLVTAGTPTNEGAFGKKNGFVVTLDRTTRKKDGTTELADTYQLVRRSADGQSSRVALERPKVAKDEVFDAAVVGPHVLWREGPLGAETTLFARALLEDEKGVGDPVELGKLPPAIVVAAHARICRTDSADFVDLRAQEGQHALVAFSAGRWHPLLFPQRGEGTFSCRGTRATYTSLEPAGVERQDVESTGPLEVHETRCDLARCETTSVRLPGIVTRRSDIDGGKLAVASLGDKVALVLVRDVMTLTLAPLPELAQAPLELIADSNANKVGGELVHRAQLLPRGDAAVLLVGITGGLRALRLDPTGKLSAVQSE